jgi:hypothetical protein
MSVTFTIKGERANWENRSIPAWERSEMADLRRTSVCSNAPRCRLFCIRCMRPVFRGHEADRMLRA